MKRLAQSLLAILAAILLAACATPTEPVTTTLNESMLFARDSAVLKKDSGKALDKLAMDLKRTAGPITVQGHTDTTGTDAINKPLSQKRAEAVKSALVKRGIAPERIAAQGYGSSMPAVKNAKSAADHQKNRRVVVIYMDDVVNR